MSTMSPQEKAISDAAIKVIVNQGFDVVSVRKVAQQAGVAPGTVQYFMGTKDELLSRALLRSAARQHERVSSLRFQSNTSPLEQLHRSLLELLPIGPIQREDAALWVILGAAASTHAKSWPRSTRTNSVDSGTISFQHCPLQTSLEI